MSKSARKRGAQLDRDIAEVLGRPQVARTPSLDVVEAFNRMVNDAAAYGAENLFWDRRRRGYTGDPKEFRFSEVFASNLPTYKYELLIEYIEQYGKRPHEGLGRRLMSDEMDWMRHEAARDRAYEQRAVREAIAAAFDMDE